MPKREKTPRQDSVSVATFSGPKPGDFAPGSVQSRAAARALLSAREEQQRRTENVYLQNLSPIEQALTEDCDDPLVATYMVRLLRVAEQRALAFEQPWPSITAEQIRRNLAIAKEREKV